MTDEEILKIKEHISIHARREPCATKMTEILRKAVDELEHAKELRAENAFYEEACNGTTMMYKDLSKAKEILRKVIDYLGQFCDDYPDCVIEAEHFLKEGD